MSIVYKKGDATRPVGEGEKIIIHVCNDSGAWGAGFVLALSRRWATPEEEYRKWANKCKPYRLPLGEVQFVRVEWEILVANIIGQRGVGYQDGKPPIRYRAIQDGLETVAERALQSKASVHGPRLGAGLAGGSWEFIEELLEQELIAKGIPVTIYDL